MSKEKISLALGTFDGMHSGHIQVIKNAVASDLKPAVLIFSEHPLSVISGKAPAELLSPEDRNAIIKGLGAEIIEIDFKKIYRFSSEQFFNGYLLEELNVGTLACGTNYSFGFGGKGDVRLLCELCKKSGVGLKLTETVMYKDEPISSTRIRKCIESGKIEQANEMLSRPFSFKSEVLHGAARGRGLGFPTANQKLAESFVKPKYGVYASYSEIDGRKYPSVTNFGVRPTVDGKNAVSETHIIGFSGNLYKKEIRVGLLKYLREEKKFASLDELSEAISGDAKTSEEIFYKHLALYK